MLACGLFTMAASGADFSTEVQTALDHSRDAVRTAKKASDLDPVLDELTHVRDEAMSPGKATGLDPALLNRIEPTAQFVTTWQDYLAKESVADVTGARQSLEELAGRGRGLEQVYLIPRSEILQRMESIVEPPQDYGSEHGPRQTTENPPERDTITEFPKPLTLDKATHMLSFDAKKLDDLDAVVTALNAVNNRPEFKSYQPVINTALKELVPMDAAYKRYESGMPMTIDLPSISSTTSKFESDLIPLKEQLIERALPRVLLIADDRTVKHGEGSYAYLKRTGAEAIASGDYLLAARTRDTIRLLQGTKDSNDNPQPYGGFRSRFNPYGQQEPALSRDMQQAQLYTAARNEDNAGQYTFAVRFYEHSLAIGNDLIPPKQIGDYLRAIQTDHPDDYAQGLRLYMSEAGIVQQGLPFQLNGFGPGARGIPNLPSGMLAVPAPGTAAPVGVIPRPARPPSPPPSASPTPAK